MSATTDRDVLIVEALAGLHAASTVLNLLCEYDEEVFSGLSERLRNELFPPDRSDPEWFWTDAIEVEIAAGSAELEALALESYVEAKAAEETFNVRAPWELRIQTALAMAPRYRAEGSSQLPWQLEDAAVAS